MKKQKMGNNHWLIRSQGNSQYIVSLANIADSFQASRGTHSQYINNYLHGI